MDQLNSDFLLHIIGFCNVQEGNALAAASKRYYYLVHHYRRLRGPELVASTSHIPGVSTRRRTSDELLRHAIDQIQAPPNLVLAFNTQQTSALAESLPAAMPDDTVILGVVASQIQTGCAGHLDYQSKAAVMLGRLSGNAVVKSLCFTEENSNNFDEQAFDDYYQQLAATGDDWKVFMVYACDLGADYVEPFIHGLQARYPDATIVGGICYEGYVSVPVEQRRERSSPRYFRSIYCA